MCSTCGCGQPDDAVTIKMAGEEVKEHNHQHHDHKHEHDHSHPHHDHEHSHDHAHHDHDHHTVNLETDILQKNNLLAERNRGFFEGREIFVYNMMSSPGSGKTTLLEKTIMQLKEQVSITIIEGDQQTMNDADRIAATGARVVQVNTGKGCHLDAHMVLHAVQKLNPERQSLLFIENVGNLVCPSLFDLGENKRVVIISVTEGEDKPLKYPTMFETADICIINKIDLLPYVEFDVEKTKEYARRTNPGLIFFELSATTGHGMDTWCNYLMEKAAR